MIIGASTVRVFPAPVPNFITQTHMSRSLPVIPPGGTIGILGGGSMGRMIGLAAHTLGYRVRLLDTTDAPAMAGIAELSITTDRLDTRAAAEVARGCDVVTIASEDVPEATL